MAKRLDAKALKGAFARGKTKRNLDFLVPSKESAAETPQVEASETALTRSGPQRRKQAKGKRTAAKRGAAKRKKTASKAKVKASANLTGASPAAEPETPALVVSEATAAPSCEGTRVVHTANGSVDLHAIEAELALTSLYDGWAPGAAVSRKGLLLRATARLRRVCDRLIGAAVRGILG